MNLREAIPYKNNCFLFFTLIFYTLVKDHFVIHADDVEVIAQIIQGPRCPLATELLWLY